MAPISSQAAGRVLTQPEAVNAPGPLNSPVAQQIVFALSVIFATGSAYRKLGIHDEERLSGRGVSCRLGTGSVFRLARIVFRKGRQAVGAVYDPAMGGEGRNTKGLTWTQNHVNSAERRKATR